FDFDSIIWMIEDGWGKIDIACPECGPTKSKSASQKRKVLAVWRDSPDFVGYHCARCGLRGSAQRHGTSADVDPQRRAALRAAAEARDADHDAQQRRKANWMWQRSHSIQGTPAETYLRSCRAIGCDLPATLRFLPPYRSDHHPAMIAAFGMAEEPEPGKLRIP